MDSAKDQRKQRNKRFRAKLRHAALTKIPIQLTRGRVKHNRSMKRICITDRSIILPNLPDELSGLRVVHLSDLHVGELLNADRLGDIVDSVNKLEGDLIAVTGDYFDLSLDVLDPVIDAMKQLAAPLGAYFVLGNHDYLDDGRRVINAFRDANLNLLVNEQQHVMHENKRIQLAGIDWAAKPPELKKLVDETLKNGEHHHHGDLSILLAHHPYAFDTAWRHGVHLTLSGHTHGGQVSFTHANHLKNAVGFGDFAFKYPQGLYRRGHSHLFVTTGIGSWFPLRVRCPAEIARLTLRSQADPTEGLSHP